MTSGGEAGATVDRQAAAEGAPDWVTATAAAALDVRPLLARGEEPFRVIMAAAAQVQPGQVLQLRSSFEPFPLYHVLGMQGFQHWARQLAPGDWEVLFYKAPAGAGTEAPHAGGGETGSPGAVPRQTMPAGAPGRAPAAGAAGVAAGPGGAQWPEPARTVTIDVSDLVPPEPMIRILEALEQIQPGEALLVNHVRRPVYLYSRLDELGYLHETRELGPGQIELRILKPVEHGRKAG